MGVLNQHPEEELQKPAEINLLYLRNRLKRDPPSYKAEFTQQVEHFRALLQVFELQCESGVLQGKTGALEDGDEDMDNVVSNKLKEKKLKELAELVDFVSHCVPHFPEEQELRQTFPRQILSVLENRYDYLSPYLRKVLVLSLIMLRNRKIIETMELLPVFLKLFNCPDKPLRQLLFSHIVNDIAKGSKGGRSNAEKDAVKAYFYQSVRGTESGSVVARKSASILIEMYRRKVWTDQRTVNVVAEMCFHPDPQIYLVAIKFFLCMFEKSDDDSAASDKYQEANNLRKNAEKNHSGKTRKRKRQKEKDIVRANKLQQEYEDEDSDEEEKNTVSGDPFGPINDLFDPQGFAERLFSELSRSKRKFEIRLLSMNVISRVISRHRLILPNYYAFLQKYVRPHQRFVTQILSYSIQASHKYVPPELLRPLLLTLCKEFVSDRSGPEAMSVGLNTIRELCGRQPEIMEEDLLRDLALYKKHKDKGVMMAARSLIGAFREINPLLLSKKDRGRDASMKMNGEESEEEGEDEEDEEDEVVSDGGEEVGGNLSDSSIDEFVDPGTLESYAKKRKLKNEQIREEAKEKQVYGARTPGGGTSNEEKKRLKPFPLVKYSRRVRGKVMQSQRDKTQKNADHIETMKNRNKHRRRRRRH